MIYEYNPKIININKAEDFYKTQNFVGYLLPNGSAFRCKEHNVKDVGAFLIMNLALLKSNYEDRGIFLNEESNNPLIMMVRNYLRKVSYEECLALSNFIEKTNVTISDLLVGFFGCHLVTRLNKTILTSTEDHRCFYNYLLNGFTINTVNKIIYDREKKAFFFQKNLDNNIELYREIAAIREESSFEERDLFLKH